jgi:hypothetical protein
MGGGKMKEKEGTITIRAQYERVSDAGYVGSHRALSGRFLEFGRPDKPESVPFTQRAAEAKKDEFFDQACENIAWQILLDEREIHAVGTEEARQMIEAQYGKMLENPAYAELSRAMAVH